MSVVKELQLQHNVLFLGYVPDQHLAALYKGARAFIFPSLYEGFGLPVLEAMASGVPVVTSKVSSLPEVAGDAAILVGPCETRALGNAMERLLKDDDLRKELIEKGLDRAAQFSWQECARRTLIAYKEALRLR